LSSRILLVGCTLHEVVVTRAKNDTYYVSD
jgi:hypothetical protein